MGHFEDLADFISKRLRMSHVYQPLMLIELLHGGGTATVEDIARAFVSEDRSQIEYYIEIVKKMPGPVLSRHKLVKRDGDGYRLVGIEDLTNNQIDTLVDMCRKRLDEYIAKRGDAIWHHRSRTSGYISGSRRYEVLKAAKFRCELCGISADERALDVDHIVPRSRGGTDDLTNLQALCWKCNQIKGNRDDADLRRSEAIYEHRDQTCVFCTEVTDRIMDENRLAFTIRDAHPVTDLHTLVIPKRHVASYFDLTRPETIAVDQLTQKTRTAIQTADPTVTAFNLGVNDGPAAGQTIGHAHIHVVPRRRGDLINPTGGVRGVIPEKQDYRAY